MATYKELKAQLERLTAETEAAKAVEQNAAIARIQSEMQEYGITPEQLGFMLAPKRKGPKAGTTAVPKYRDPQSGATWSGKGRAPSWLPVKGRDKFLIADQLGGELPKLTVGTGKAKK